MADLRIVNEILMRLQRETDRFNAEQKAQIKIEREKAATKKAINQQILEQAMAFGRAAFGDNKAIQIAGAIIDTFRGVNAALALGPCWHTARCTDRRHRPGQRRQDPRDRARRRRVRVGRRGGHRPDVRRSSAAAGVRRRDRSRPRGRCGIVPPW